MYVALVYDDLLQSSTASDRLHVELHDLQAPPAQQLVYRSKSSLAAQPAHLRRLPMEFGGRSFRLDIASTPVLEAGESNAPIWMSGGLGGIASVLGALLVWQLERSRRRAEALAARLTRDFDAQKKQLATSHAFLDRTGAVAGVGSWEIDLATGAVVWSEQIRRMLEAPPHYRPGIDGDLELFFSQDARPRIRAAVERAMQDGTPWDLVVPVTTFRGNRRWVRSAGDAEREDGKVVRLLGALLDVTDRHEAGLELERSRSLLQTTLRSIGDAVLTADLDARVQWLNPEAERLTGWRSADAAGRPVTDILRLAIEGHPDRAVCPIQTCLTEQRSVGLEPDTVLIARDGTRFFIDDSAAPLRADDGHMLGVVMVFRDITAKRDLERQTALARSRRELVELTDTLTEGFLVVDRDWNILGANPALGGMFGLDPATCLGRSMWECLPQFEAPALSEALHLTRRTQRRHDIELTLPDQRILAGRVHPHHAGLALNLWDETAQRRHQERLERSSDLFRAVNRAALVAVRKLGDTDLLQVLTEELRNAVDAHLAAIHLLPVDEQIRPPPAVSLSDKYAAWRSFDRPIKGLGLLAEAASKRGVLRLTQDELLRHPAFDNYSDAAGQHPALRGLLSVSLVERSGRVLGFLQVSDRREGEFDDDDVAICVQFGQLAAITIEWGRHLEQLEHAHREVERRLQQLRGQRDLLGAAERLAGSASWLLVRHGETLDMEWSSALLKMLAVETPAAERPSLDALLAQVPPEDRDGLARAIDGALRFGAEATIDHRLRTTEAPSRWVRHRIRVLDQDGSVRVLGTLQPLGQLDGQD